MLQLHYCWAIKALTARLHWREHTVGFDLYLTGLTLWRWRGQEEHVWDFGKVGG